MIRIARSRLLQCPCPQSSWLRGTLSSVLAAAGYKSYDIGLRLTTSSSIQRLNKRYRGVDAPTDILSFGRWTSEMTKPESFPEESTIERDLGDLVIAPSYVNDQLQEMRGISQDDAASMQAAAVQHWHTLLIHGVVHLLGYDHEKEDDYRVMAAREAGIASLLLSPRNISMFKAEKASTSSLSSSSPSAGTK